ncbi:hypothetical protein [Enterococcus sp. DIV1420a]|uniref:hypothetical protein n=1 Tax=Enterococcus sp. DIV1420a TaxID=2774672 RepID=UPI003F219967
MITTNLKQRLVEAYQVKLNKIVLNGNITVIDFTKVIEQTQLVIQFKVPAEITEITTISFYEATDLLAEHQLYVPIVTDTVFKYKVEVSAFGERVEK